MELTPDVGPVICEIFIGVDEVVHLIKLDTF